MSTEPLHKGNYLPGTDIPAKKNEGCTGYTCCRCMVVLYGVFFLLIGGIVLSVAVWVQGVKSDYQSINDLVTLPMILAIVAGIAMVVMSLCGIIGAVREHILLLKLFLGAIIIVFIIQVIVGILAFIYRERTHNTISEQMQFAVKGYRHNDEIQQAIDYLQQKYSCCGLTSPKDWDDNPVYSCANGNCGVPESCCREPQKGCGNTVRFNSTRVADLRRRGINTPGCMWSFLVWVEGHLDAVGATTLGLAIPQILGIFLVFIFIQKVEDRIYLFKYRKRIYED